MTFPTVASPESMPEDEQARIRAEFIDLGVNPTDIPSPESEAPKRGRGRPKGSRNRRPSVNQFRPIRLDDEEVPESPFPPLASPPLSTRDAKEVSKRFEGILVTGTGIAALFNPILQMTEQEAEAIAIPLSTYLLRQEATSKAAKQILEEYDLVAFGFALAAYVVRVFRDFQNERLAVKNERTEPRPVSSTGDTPPESGETIQQSSLQNQGGEERPANRELASASGSVWTPAGL